MQNFGRNWSIVWEVCPNVKKFFLVVLMVYAFLRVMMQI